MFKVATYNMENLDFPKDDYSPALEIRSPTLRSTLNRLDADIFCLQEIHGQELDGHTSDNPKRELLALKEVLKDTKFFEYEIASTKTTSKVPYDKRNLVVLSKYQVESVEQYRNDLIDNLMYRKVTAKPKEEGAKNLGWERLVLHVKVKHPQLGIINVINLHLKSKLASYIDGQKKDRFTWESAAGWAEGFFLSSIKRVGQALETRILIDKIFDGDLNANIIVCGDFNAEPGEVPVEAIRGRVENTNNPDLRSRVLTSCSKGIPESVRFSHLHHGHGNLLDHILISQSLLPFFRSAQIFNENLHDESLPYNYDSKFPESDHAAFVAEFNLN